MKLGERMDVVTLTIKGHCSVIVGTRLLDELVTTLGMNKVHDPITYDYPAGGSGGTGFTRIQPITESFIAFDAWPDFGGAYLIICSCKTVNINKLSKKVRALGFKIKQIKAHELRLRNGF